MKPYGSRRNVRGSLSILLVLFALVLSGPRCTGAAQAQEPAAENAAPAEKPAEAATPPAATPPAATLPAATPPAETPAPAATPPAEKPPAAVTPPAAAPPAEPKLRFNFRYQLWEEVLQWVADEAGLSLVMDHPPSATFNYIDSKEYEPVEAIDLLNNVLVTKGFTLIRRGQMLIVVDVKNDGIPQGLVPQVTLEELNAPGKRGDFEIVGVRFPLGRRDGQLVRDEVAPLLGPHGKAVFPAGTKHLLVTDTAATMRVIAVVIESIPEPPAPKPKPESKKPEKPEKPVLQGHELKTASPEAILEVLSQLIPGDKFVMDEKTGRLTANIVPSHHAIVTKVIEDMEAEASPEWKKTLEVYPVDLSSADPGTYPRRNQYGKKILAPPPGTDPVAGLLETLQLMVPGAKLTVDKSAGHMTAWATTAEHETIKLALEKLGTAPSGANAPQFEVFRLSMADPQAVLDMFRSLLPDAQLSLDTKNRNLVALTVPNELDVIRAALERLQASPDGADAPELRFYPLGKDPSANLISIVEEMVPNSQVTLDAANKRVMVVATAAEHEKVKETIDKIEQSTPDTENRLVIYQVTPRQKARFQQVQVTLAAKLSQIQMLADAKPNQLSIWATPAEHKIIAGLLDEIKGDDPAEGAFQLAVYPIKAADPQTVFSMLTELYPDTKIVLDPKANRLLVWAMTSEQASIKTALEQLSTADPKEQPRFETYTIQGYAGRSAVALATFTTQLQLIAPAARITPDTTGGKLIVWAKPDEHVAIEAAIESLGQGESPTLSVYTFTKADPTTTLALLQQLVPEARLSLDQKTSDLIAVATAEDHLRIKATLDQLQPLEAGPDAPVLQFHPLQEELPASVLALLETLAPKAEITADPENKRLMVLASPADQERIAAMIARVEEAGPTTPELRFHALKEVVPASVMAILQTLAPRAQVTVDDENKRLIVVATPADHEIVQKTIAEVEQGGPTTQVLQFITLEDELSASVLTVITTLVPRAQVTLTDDGKTLMVVATPSDFEMVKSTVEEAMMSLGPEENNTLVVYPVTPAQRTRFQALMTSVSADMPGIQILSDSEPGVISVWAKPSQHESLSEIFAQLKREVPVEDKYRLATYPVTSADPQNVLTMLLELFPETQIVLDEKTNRLLIWTRGDEHDAIKSAMAEIDMASTAAEQRRFESFSIQGAVGLSAASRSAAADAIVEQLQSLVPNARLTFDPKTGKLVAFGTPAELMMIRVAVEKLGHGGKSAIATPQLEIHPLSKADATTTMQLLAGLVPGAEIQLDSPGNRLIVFATPEDQEAIRNTLSQLQSDALGPDSAQLRFYPLEETPPANLVTGLAQLVPGAQATLDAEGKNLMVVATTADHALVKKALEEIATTMPAQEKASLVVYPVTPSQGKRFKAAVEAIKSDMPDVRVVEDDEPGQISVWAKPSEQEVIGEVLQQLKIDVSSEGQRRFEAYPLGGVTGYELSAPGRLTVSTTLMTGLQTLVPGSKLLVDAAGEKLIAWASDAEHAMIGDAVEKLALDALPENAVQIAVYPLTMADSTSILTMFRTLLPEAELAVDSQSGNLVALAVPKDQETIVSTLARLQPKEAGPNALELRFYPLSKAPPNTLISGLNTVVPRARLTLDALGKTLMALATPADHQTIKAAVEKLEAAVAKGHPSFESYSVQGLVSRDASGRPIGNTAFLSSLQSLVPGARMSIDSETGKLIVWGTSKDHEMLQAAVAQLDKKDSPETTPQLKVYPLTKADSASVLQLLGTLAPRANLSIDTATGSLVALAVAKDHKMIQETLEQLQPAEPGPNTPELRFYSLTERPPSTMITGLMTLVPKAQLTLDALGTNLMAVATPADHETIKKNLDIIETAASTEGGPYFDTYTITSIGGPAGTSRYSSVSALLAPLTPLVPNVRLSVDPKTGKLIAWATAKEHEKLKAAIEKLTGGDSPENAPVVEIHPLTRADPATTMTLLQTMVPGAQVSIEQKTGNLVALATPADQELIRSTLERLQSGEPGPNTPELRFYPLARSAPATLLAGLQQLAPTAQLTLDPGGEHLMAVATPADHEVIKANLDKVEAAAGMEQRNELKVYSVTPSQRRRFDAVMPNVTGELPGIKVIADAAPGELSIWAKPSQHATLSAIIDELKREVPPEQKFQLVAYPIKSTDVDSVLAVLADLFPDTRFTLDRRGRRIMAYTLPAEQAEITAALEKMESGLSGEMEEKFVSYPVPAALSATAYTVLHDLLPDVTLYPDASGGKLVAWAREQDHELIAKTLDQLQTEPDTKFQPYLVVYPPGDNNLTSLQQLLGTLVPEARVVVDSNAQTLSVFATARDHETVMSMMNSMSAAAMGVGERTVVTYSVENTTASAASTMLRTIVPGAQLSIGSDTHQLIAWAFPQDHKKIDAVVEQLSAGGPPESAPVLKTYALQGVTASSASLGLSRIVPEAVMTYDSADPYKLIAFARPTDHETIAQAVEELSKEPPAETAPALKIYTVDRITASVAIQILQSVVPRARLNPGTDTYQVVAWARPDEHRKIADTLGEIDVEGPDEKIAKAVIYDLTSSDSRKNYYIQRFLRLSVPTAVFTEGMDASQMVVWARPADHEKIANLLQQIEKEVPPEKAPKLKTYSLKAITTRIATQMLGQIVPGAEVSQGSDPHQLIVWASPADHEKVESVLGDLDKEGAADAASIAKTYSLKEISAQSASLILRQVMPEIRPSLGSDPKQLIVYARPFDHAVIAATLEQIDVQSARQKDSSMAIYTLEASSSNAARYQVRLLQQIVPEATYSPGSDPSQLIVFATAEDHKRITELIAELEKEPPAEIAPTPVTYVLNEITAAAAQQVLTLAVPQARMTPGSEDNQFIAYARPAEHKKIEEVLRQIDVETPAATVLKIYPLKTASRRNYYTYIRFLQSELPGAIFTLSEDNSQLLARAKPKDHEKIPDLIKQVELEPRPEVAPKVEIYRLGRIDSRSVGNILEEIAPEAEFEIDSDRDQLIAYASPSDHKKIAEAIAKLSEEESPETAAKAVTYVLEEINANDALQVLRAAVPQVELNTGSSEKQFIAYARPADHKKIAEILEQIDVETSDNTVLKIYQLKTNAGHNYYTYSQPLQREFPAARFSLSQDNSQLIVRAKPSDHEKIVDMIGQIEQDPLPEAAPRVVAYPLGRLNVQSVSNLLRRIASPQSQFEVDSEANELIVYANPSDHKKIAEAIAKLSEEESPETAAKAVTYVLEEIDADDALQVLRAAVPRVELNTGSNENQFIAYARPADHKKIADILEQIDIETPDNTVLKIYQLKTSSRRNYYTYIRFLEKEVSGATFTLSEDNSQLLARARPKDHEKIPDLIKQVEQEPLPEFAPKVETYALGRIEAGTVTNILEEITPEAEFEIDSDTNQLIAYASPSDHKKIAEAIAKLSEAESPETAAKAVTYVLDEIDADDALEVLEVAVPQAELSTRSEENQFIAYARPADHKKIAEILETIDVETPDATELKIYTLNSNDSRRNYYAYVLFLQEAVPGATFTLGRDPSQLLARAKPKDHEKIPDLIKQVEQEPPPETAPRVEIYSLGRLDPDTAIDILDEITPNAQFEVDADAGQLIAYARPDEHKKIADAIAKLSEEESPETAAKAATYALEETTATVAIEVLQNAVPQAKFSTGEDPQQLIAWARPDEQKQIEAILQEIDVEGPGDKDSSVVVYKLKGFDSRRSIYALTMLREVVPEAIVTLSADRTSLVVWAKAKDHEKVKQVVDQLVETPETARRIVIYPLEEITPSNASQVLRDVVPEAEISTDNDLQQITAWANPDDHKLIEATLEQIDVKAPEGIVSKPVLYQLSELDDRAVYYAIRLIRDAIPAVSYFQGRDESQVIFFATPKNHKLIKELLDQLVGDPEDARTAEVYTLKWIEYSEAYAFLRRALRDAEFSAGAEPQLLVAWGRPAEHEKIATILEQVDVEAPPETVAQMVVYPLKKNDDVATVIRLLNEVVPKAQFGVGADTRQLIAWARPPEHKKIAEFIDKMPEAVEPTSVVYRFRKADPRAAYTALSTLVPEAQIAYDTLSRNLVVVALPEDHEKIKATVDEIEREAEEAAPELKIHRIRTANPVNLLTVLSNLFRTDRDIQLSMDSNNDSLIAYASAEQHERIADLIAEVEKGALEDSSVRLEIHSMKDVDTYSAMSTVEDVLEQHGAKASLSSDYRRNAIVAIARPEAHEIIRDTLDQLRGDERIMEIMQLDYIELGTAEMAIDRLFDGDGYLSAPDVDLDPDNQQLFIRGTVEQLKEIRKLLIKMGEVGLASVTSGSDSRLRVVPFKGDVKSIVEQLQRIWPQLRDNQIHVVSPDDLLPAPKTQPEPKTNPQSKPQPTPATPATKPEAKQPQKQDVKPQKQDAKEKPAAKDNPQPRPKANAAKGPSGPEGATGTSGVAGPAAVVRSDSGGTSAAEPVSVPGAPVTLMIGDRSVTIASDDLEALDELESLLHTLSERSSDGILGRNYSMFEIRNTSAGAISQVLQQMFRDKLATSSSNRNSSSRYGSSRYGSSRYGRTSTPLVITPDERLNTILVQGSRADRSMIESLITVLDTDDVPDTFAARKPRLIPIKNVRASQIETTLRTIFSSQLGTSSSRSTASAGFRPQLAVDEVTNTLILTAPAPLIDEISDLAESLDKKAGDDPAKGIRIIPLKKSNASRVEKALDAIMRSSSTYRRR